MAHPPSLTAIWGRAINTPATIISKLWCNKRRSQALGLQKGLQGGKIPHYRSKQMKIYFWVCWTNSISIKHFLERWVRLHPAVELTVARTELFCPRPWQGFSHFFGKFSLNCAGSAVLRLGCGSSWVGTILDVSMTPSDSKVIIIQARCAEEVSGLKSLPTTVSCNEPLHLESWILNWRHMLVVLVVDGCREP